MVEISRTKIDRTCIFLNIIYAREKRDVFCFLKIYSVILMIENSDIYSTTSPSRKKEYSFSHPLPLEIV